MCDHVARGIDVHPGEGMERERRTVGIGGERQERVGRTIMAAISIALIKPGNYY